MIGHQTALSGALMVSARLLSRAVDLLTMLILARLLTPEDFGLTAIAMTVVVVLEAAFELPLSQALVQLPKLEPHYLHTAFTISLLRGVLLCTVCSLLAIPFSRWYGHPELTSMIQLLSLAPAARGIQNPRLAEYAKILNFKYEFYFELIGKALAFLTGSTTAYLSHSYWAIALCTIIAPVVTSICGYIFLPYRPRLSLRDWRLFSGFLGWISLSQIVMAVNFQSDQLLLGKLMPPAKLGLFTTANNLTFIPINALFGPVLRPLLSAFTLLRGDKEALNRSYQIAANAVVAIGLPLLVGQAVVARPMVVVLLGAQWASAAPLFKWLSISLIPYLFGMLLTPLGMALGQTQEIAWRNIVQLIVKLPLIVIAGILYGFPGIIFARLVSETATAIFCMISIRGLTEISLRRQFSGNLRALLACAVMLAVLISVDFLFHFSPSWGGQFVRLGLLISSGAVSYSVCLLSSWYLAGRPPGLEAIAVRSLQGLRHVTVSEGQAVL